MQMLRLAWRRPGRGSGSWGTRPGNLVIGKSQTDRLKAAHPSSVVVRLALRHLFDPLVHHLAGGRQQQAEHTLGVPQRHLLGGSSRQSQAPVGAAATFGGSMRAGRGGSRGSCAKVVAKSPSTQRTFVPSACTYDTSACASSRSHSWRTCVSSWPTVCCCGDRAGGIRRAELQHGSSTGGAARLPAPQLLCPNLPNQTPALALVPSPEAGPTCSGGRLPRDRLLEPPRPPSHPPSCATAAASASFRCVPICAP